MCVVGSLVVLKVRYAEYMKWRARSQKKEREGEEKQCVEKGSKEE